MFGLVGRDRSPSGPNGCLGEASLPRDPPGAVFDIVIGNPPYVRQEELKNQTVIGSDGKPRPLKDALKGQYECFTGTADLYVYFFERSLQLLRTGGVLSFITSNKYFRAGYGERLRTYLAYATRPSVVLDFGDAPVFTSIAYPAILVTQKTRSVELGQLPKSLGRDGPPGRPQENGRLGEASLPASRVMTWTPGPDIREFPDIFERDAFALAQRDLKPDGWRMENPVSLRLLERLRKAGTPLGEYVKGRFYYGIKTGLNEAFVVDRVTRDRMIAEHPSSKDVLKPFLRGRDVKRWRCEFSEQYLIKIESSENKEHPWSGRNEKEAEKVFAITYPAVHAFFDTMCKALVKRYDQGKYFWELRSCDYWQEFEQPKVIYPNICDCNRFAWDDLSFFANQKTFIIPNATKFLLGYLNSSVVMWLFTQLIPKLQNGFYEPGAKFLGQFPIPPATPTQQSLCERLAEALIWLHGRDASPRRPENGAPSGRALPDDANVSPMIAYFEQWLNGLVYELFFPDELHARKLKLFDETAKLNPPDLAKLSDSRKLAVLQELHAKAYDRGCHLARNALRPQVAGRGAGD